MPELAGYDVPIVDDIPHTGETPRVVQGEIGRSNPRSAKTAVLLRKPGKAPPEIPVDLVGFDIEDVFVVGCGLDHGDLYHDVPYNAVLRPEAMGAGKKS